MGDTSKRDIWDDLKSLVSEKFEVEGSKLYMGIQKICIDSGYRTTMVYRFVRQMATMTVVPVKGSDSLATLIGLPKAAEVNQKGKNLRRGVKVWPVGVSIAKSEIYGFLNAEKAKDGEDDNFGYCHFPEYDEEFFKQLTAEKIVTKFVRGFQKTEWVKDRERNEVLDCRVYNRCAASMLGLDRFKDSDWDKLRPSYDTINETGESKPKSKKKKTRKRESIW